MNKGRKNKSLNRNPKFGNAKLGIKEFFIVIIFITLVTFLILYYLN